MPPSFWTDPLMYQGGSDAFLGPRDPIPVADEAYGIDFEAEVAVVTGDVTMGASPDRAASLIRLVLLVNDVSLRNLIPAELAKGFGFFQSKPSSALSPVAVTPDELGPAWDGRRVTLPLHSIYNGQAFGCPNAGVDMNFDFPTLIAHAAKTRPLGAGTIVGSGTVSNRDLDGGPGRPIRDGGVGYSCIAEIRTVETIRNGQPSTPFMKFGDRIRIEMKDASGHSIFGAIERRWCVRSEIAFGRDSPLTQMPAHPTSPTKCEVRISALHITSRSLGVVALRASEGGSASLLNYAGAGA
jgi:fumarylacetoacetate (FAA) hydrolase